MGYMQSKADDKATPACKIRRRLTTEWLAALEEWVWSLERQRCRYRECFAFANSLYKEARKDAMEKEKKRKKETSMDHGGARGW